MNYLVSSFIAILHRVNEDCAFFDENMTIGELLANPTEFDELEFEMAKLCFEATHRITIAERDEDYSHLTIEEYIETFAESEQDRNPLFVTERFLLYRQGVHEAQSQRRENEGTDEALPERE